MMPEVVRNVLHYSYGYSMGSLWINMNVELEGRDVTFEQQTEAFFSMLKLLMMEGKLKLASQGVFADGDVDGQLGALRRAWPAARDQADLDEHGFWFLSDAPFGLVWMSPEGDVWS
ncbi:DUF596 domain-containing protein [Stenotrophomonas maltophilia]|uniref:DUF596 domain-containing protein n=1 Tax=Stenotrophomonas maltophilia TaxID=40324 RepID=UPI00163D7869|nr:DUF596 domain-containing protein [Stenotrophomonas maltophilia]MCU1065101.1 DUF596 domain-containing protein [Stenotrophomonas maltophilia]